MSMNAILAVALTSGVIGADHGVVWHADTAVRQPTEALTINGPVTIPHGASGHDAGAMMLVRQDNIVIAASPFVSYHGAGMHDYRRAQQAALREMGLILSVRTHVNSRRKAEPRNDIEPRAVIHIKDRFQVPTELEANAPSRKGTQLVRVIRPGETTIAAR